MAKLTILLAVIIACAVGEKEQPPNEYIIVFPESKMITLGQDPPADSDSTVEYGKFQCAVRADVHPLWIINGLSATVIKDKAGFENVNYSTHPLPSNGTFSLLYVPGFAETNNSIIRCGAVVGEEVVAYSEPANFTVYCDWNCSVNADNDLSMGTTVFQTTTMSMTGSVVLPTDKGPSYTSIAPHLIAGISVVVIIGVLLMAVTGALIVVLCVWVKRRKSRRIGHNARSEGNVYWNSSGRNLLEESITSQELKTPQ